MGRTRLKTEIVVPSDYAATLDALREHRLGIADANFGYSNGGRNYYDRVLPEQIAESLKLLPQPNLVRSVLVLDHANPFDMQTTYEDRVRAQKNGHHVSPYSEFVSGANASIDGSAVIRYFKPTTNDIGDYTRHEWAHLAQSNQVFDAFDSAAKIEKDGYFTREYALKNNHENWAVHFGEQFLGPSGYNFSQLPENAPARTLVMAKALQNILESRADNPTPRHEEFMTRAQAAEERASMAFRQSIVRDFESGNSDALNDKIRFLNTAAGASESPELIDKVFRPQDTYMVRSLVSKGVYADNVNELQLFQLTSQLRRNFTPETLHNIIEKWKTTQNSNVSVALYKSLPEQGKQVFLDEVTSSPTSIGENFLRRMTQESDEKTVEKFKKIFEQTQVKFESEALDLLRQGKSIPRGYSDWLRFSDNGEARVAWVSAEGRFISDFDIDFSFHMTKPQTVKDIIANDIMSYVWDKDKPGAWSNFLNRLPQSDQVSLFRELSEKHDPAYTKLADDIDKMSDTEFGANTKFIQDTSFDIMSKREQAFDYILANRNRIQNEYSFADVTKNLDSAQLKQLLKSGILDSMEDYSRESILDNVSTRLDFASQLEIVETLDATTHSRARITALSRLEGASDRSVAIQAAELLKDAEALKAHYESDLISADDADKRLEHFYRELRDSGGKVTLETAMRAVRGLSEPQLIRFLESPAASHLDDFSRSYFYDETYQNGNLEVRKLLRIMGNLRHLDLND